MMAAPPQAGFDSIAQEEANSPRQSIFCVFRATGWAKSFLIVWLDAPFHQKTAIFVKNLEVPVWHIKDSVSDSV